MVSRLDEGNGEKHRLGFCQHVGGVGVVPVTGGPPRRRPNWTPQTPVDTVVRREILPQPEPPTRPERVPPDLDPPRPNPSGTGGESEWIAAAQAGDRSAFARVVEAYWDRLYRWLYHLTRDRHRAEDLTQETFLKALAAVKSFRAGSNFRAWLFRIAHNNFVNLKRAERKSPQPPGDEPPTPDTAAGPLATAADREALDQVAKAIKELPVDFRTALMLRAEEGMSFREVAAVLGITEETARWRVFKARQKLVKVLSPDLFPEADGESGE
jgi:RNA polymerase sigma-70 factor (ECF subfamily)